MAKRVYLSYAGKIALADFLKTVTVKKADGFAEYLDDWNDPKVADVLASDYPGIHAGHVATSRAAQGLKMRPPQAAASKAVVGDADVMSRLTGIEDAILDTQTAVQGVRSDALAEVSRLREQVSTLVTSVSRMSEAFSRMMVFVEGAPKDRKAFDNFKASLTAATAMTEARS